MRRNLLRRVVIVALDAYVGYLVVDLVLELRRPAPEAEPRSVQLLDRDGAVIATYDRARH